MKLTKQERSSLKNGEAPRIVRDTEDPPAVPGEVIPVVSQLEIIVSRCVKTKAGDWRVDYTMRDLRPRMLRRVPPIYVVRSNEEGEVKPPSSDDIKDARLTGSYTTSPHEAVSDAGEGVDDEYLGRFAMNAKEARVTRRREEHAEEEVRKDVRQVTARLRDLSVQMVRAGVDPTRMLARVQREMQEGEESLREAA